MRTGACNQGYFTQEGSQSNRPNRRSNKELPRQKKSKRIHFQQTSSARDAKGTAFRKGRKRERHRNTGMKKMAMNNYLSIITLNVSGLNAPIKKHRIPEWIRQHDPRICCLQETQLRKKDLHRLKVKG